jgi:hypothetical protein
MNNEYYVFYSHIDREVNQVKYNVKIVNVPKNKFVHDVAMKKLPKSAIIESVERV